MPWFWRVFVRSMVLVGCTSAFLAGQSPDLERAASQLATRIPGSQGARVAVADFTDLQGRVTDLGRYYAEEFSVALVNTGGTLKVMDRGRLRALLAESKPQAVDGTDEGTMAEMGRASGIDFLVTGSVTELPDAMRLTLHALNTRTGALQAATSLSVPKSPAVLALLQRTGQGKGSHQATDPGAVPRVRMFQNDFLAASADALSVRRDGDWVYAYLSLSLENKTGQEEYVTCRCRSYSGNPGDPEVSLMDSQGSGWQLLKVTGLPLAQTHVDLDRSRFVRLAPGARQTVIVSFRARIPGTGADQRLVASFAMEMARYREAAPHHVEHFSLGLSGIPSGK